MSKADDRLAELYSLHGQSAVRLACLLTGDEQAGQDIAQEAFVRLGGRLATLRHPEKAAGYLFRIIGNLSKDHGRTLKRERTLTSRLDEPSPVSTPPDLAERDHVWRALTRLTIGHRTVLFLRYYLDLSEWEASLALQLSVSATKSLTHRAAEAMRKELGEDYD